MEQQRLQETIEVLRQCGGLCAVHRWAGRRGQGRTGRPPLHNPNIGIVTRGKHRAAVAAWPTCATYINHSYTHIIVINFT